MTGPSYPALPGFGATRIFLACGTTDMRKGFDGLAVMAQQVLKQSPHSGAIFAFRGKRGDLVKLLWYDGQGLYQGAVIPTYEDCHSRLLARRSGSGDVVHRRDAPTKSSGRE
ncbi:MAG: IS66 family insertion sequence element accessory protein TnpB, partial [Minicystis sp.]